VVLVAGAGQALQAAPRALTDARAGFVSGAPDQVARAIVARAPSQSYLVDSIRACLVAGATTAIELTRDEERRSAPGEERRVRAALVLGRRPDGGSVDAGLEFSQARNRAEAVELAQPVFTDWGATTWAAIMPSPFSGEGARWILFIARAVSPPLPPVPGAAIHEEEVARAARDLAAQVQSGARLAAPPPPPTALPDVTLTRRSLLGDRAHARRSLYALATATGARTAEVMAIAAEDQTLAQVASAVATALGSVDPTRPDEVGLTLERATLAACQRALAADSVEEGLPIALEYRGGAALRLLPSLAGELTAVSSLAALEERIVSLNVRLLLDPSPTIRVRAARWLSTKIDLKGYHALGPQVERRAAVAAIERASGRPR
jgi:hypothetical protein